MSQTLSSKEHNKSRLNGPEYYRFLTKYQTCFLPKGNSINGFAVYAATIRAIFSKAIKAELRKKELSPFDEFQIKKKPAAKRAIAVEDIKRLLTVDVGQNPKLLFAQDLFATSFYLMGASFKDLAYLKVSDVQNG